MLPGRTAASRPLRLYYTNKFGGVGFRDHVRRKEEKEYTNTQ